MVISYLDGEKKTWKQKFVLTSLMLIFSTAMNYMQCSEELKGDFHAIPGKGKSKTDTRDEEPMKQHNRIPEFDLASPSPPIYLRWSCKPTMHAFPLSFHQKSAPRPSGSCEPEYPRPFAIPVSPQQRSKPYLHCFPSQQAKRTKPPLHKPLLLLLLRQ